ncbi:MAG: type II toxin-antitoxin system RelE/ParE family toxin [Chloroflexi bacterium]|nr:type II toxin-antitoxin system RelE/ParE family toxin [Chloroflexota bacterium]
MPARVRKQIESIPSEHDRKAVRSAISAMVTAGPVGDIKKLQGNTGEYRLRVGRWRIRFLPDFRLREVILTHAALRKDVYR